VVLSHVTTDASQFVGNRLKSGLWDIAYA